VCDNREMDAINYLDLIRDAQVYDVAIETPLEVANILSARLKNQVLMKREDLQPIFSFKLRGAYNKIAGLTDAELGNGVICSSAGNHAQGVALAARKRGIRAVIVMPVTTPTIKVDAVRALGGEVVLKGDAYDDAYAHARQLEDEQQLTFIHPFDDPAVIAGQGTIGAEILKQAGSDIDAVFVPIGGGGLIAGIATCIKLQHPNIRIIGVEPDYSAAMRDSWAMKRFGYARNLSMRSLQSTQISAAQPFAIFLRTRDQSSSLPVVSRLPGRKNMWPNTI